jgi:hypothetical protein
MIFFIHFIASSILICTYNNELFKFEVKLLVRVVELEKRIAQGRWGDNDYKREQRKSGNSYLARFMLSVEKAPMTTPINL